MYRLAPARSHGSSQSRVSSRVPPHPLEWNASIHVRGRPYRWAREECRRASPWWSEPGALNQRCVRV
ncbi:hypothetical protein [Nonomuraea recticatena]|uniref:hypothetical protein n=1 Tax=Nonomuraea recticatena TaxID=46178 RepID=UPI00360EAE79